MDDVKMCPECGVPEPITSENLWLDSGAIVQKRDEKHRLVFVESDNLDPIFHIIGKTIGVPIEHIVINAGRKGTRDYVDRLIPDELKNVIQKRELDVDPVVEVLASTALIMGFGATELTEVHSEKDEYDHVSVRIENPHSISLLCGENAGALEAILGYPWDVTYTETSTGIFEANFSKSKNPPELEQRVQRKVYQYKKGNIEHARCTTCGGPAALSEFKWDLHKGIITNALTQRRLSLVGEIVSDAPFEELEKELGETIPQVVVEAQRSFTKTGFFSTDEMSDEDDFRAQLALRGLGNLRELEMGRKGLRLRLDGAVSHLLTVGMVQGLFELTFGVDTHAEWELSTDGNLEAEISPV